MTIILMVSSPREPLAGLEEALARGREVEVVRASSGEQALGIVRSGPVDLVVVDEDLGDMPGLALAKKLLSLDASVCCALVSGLLPEGFVEATEGLGILAHLPRRPGAAEAEELFLSLERIKGPIGKSPGRTAPP